MKLTLLAVMALLALLLCTKPTLAAVDSPEARLKAAGFTLPKAPTPVAAYVTWRRSGNTLYLSGHGDCRKEFPRGKVGRELSLEQGRVSAEQVGLCMLATIRSAVGDLSQVKQFLRIDGMVNATTDFTRQPQVINGFSELMVVAFGESGLGARAAVGMGSLPGNIPVEISAVIELKDAE